MKKKVLLVAALLTAGMTFAQEEFTSKKGVPILPEAGDYALGFDATNFLNYGGNLMNGNTGNSFNNLGLQPTYGNLTIYGKYFKDANTAYRAMVRLGYGTTTNRSVVPDLSSGASANATVENEFKQNGMNITIGGGYEMRRGSGRLQGVYGPIAMISFGSASTENTYGNSLEEEFNNQFPIPIAGDSYSRTTETKQGSVFGIAAGGFAGVEYFFAPKFSLGAEIMWTIAFVSQANGESTTETYSYDGTEGTETSTTTETGGFSSFSFDTRPNANLSLNFHF